MRTKKSIFALSMVAVFVLGIALLSSGMNTTYSMKEEEAGEVSSTETLKKAEDLIENGLFPIDKVKEESKEEVKVENKKGTYSYDEYLSSIAGIKESGNTASYSKYNDLYAKFYEYFDEDKMFTNMYDEQYSVEEYIFATTYSKNGKNADFGLYLVGTKKCDVFNNMSVDVSSSLKTKYCQ